MTRTSFLKDLRDMSTKELQERLKRTQVELIKFRAHGESLGLTAIPPHPKFIRNLKKDIARAKTILRERGIKC